MKRIATSALLLCLAAGCTMLPNDQQGNIYDLRREAHMAYGNSEDERAEKLLIGLSRAAPNEPETWFTLGNLYARTNRPEKATEAYQRALMINSADARAWHNLGVVKLREAWAAFIQAFNASTPDNPLHGRVETLITLMEKMPLEGMTRAPRPASAAAPTPAAAAPAPAPAATDGKK